MNRPAFIQERVQWTTVAVLMCGLSHGEVLQEFYIECIISIDAI